MGKQRPGAGGFSPSRPSVLICLSCHLVTRPLPLAAARDPAGRQKDPVLNALRSQRTEGTLPAEPCTQVPKRMGKVFRRDRVFASSQSPLSLQQIFPVCVTWSAQDTKCRAGMGGFWGRRGTRRGSAGPGEGEGVGLTQHSSQAHPGPGVCIHHPLQSSGNPVRLVLPWSHFAEGETEAQTGPGPCRLWVAQLESHPGTSRC